MKNTFIYLVFTFFTFWLVGCIGEPEPAVDYSERDEELISTHLAENGITNATRHSSGLYYIIDEVGEASEDSIIYNTAVVIHSKGKLLDGTVFLDTKTTLSPSLFEIQNHIYAFQIALPFLKRGGEIQLFVPSHLGYGNNQLSNVPANSVLIYDLEVLDFFPYPYSTDSVIWTANQESISLYKEKNNITDMEVTETGIHYKMLEEGTGTGYPLPTDSVKVSYTGRLIDDTIFDYTEEGETLSFPLNKLISGWQEGLQKMKKGEKAQLMIPSNLGYGSSDVGTIPANSVLIFEIELIDFGF